MIFYTALDERGHTQLRGTQADAKAVNRAFEQIDIPTDKTGLMAFVQGLYTRIDELSDQIAEGGEGLPAATLLEQDIIDQAEPAIADFVEDEAQFDAAVLETQVEALGVMGAEALDRFDGWSETQGVSAAFARGVALLNVIASDQHAIAKMFLRDRLKKRRRFGG